MNEQYTHINVVLDRSGSMEAIKHDVIGGFNHFLAEQKKVEDKCTLTLIQFDGTDPYEVISAMQPVETIKSLTDRIYLPRGSTPLLDCMGKAITELGNQLLDMPESERPSKVIFVTVTDGEENASREFNHPQVQRMIETQREIYKWEFVFLSSDLNAVDEGISMGVAMASAMAFDNNSAGMRNAFASVASNVTSYRTGRSHSTAFTEEDRVKQANEQRRSRSCHQ